MTKTITCPCGNTLVTDSSNYTADALLAGWLPNATHTGRIIFLCPECRAKVQALAAQIVELTGTDQIYFPTLLYKES